MYRARQSTTILSPRTLLLGAALASFLFPLVLSHLASFDSVYIPFCQAQPESKLSSLPGTAEPAWRDIGPWEQMVWISKMAPRRGALLTEDSTMKLLKELATVGSPQERKDFLREELRKGLVTQIAESNQELRRMAADVFVLGAIDSLERDEYIQAEGFLRGSKVQYPGLESQRVIELEIRRRYWQPDAVEDSGIPWLQIGLGALACYCLFVFLFGKKEEGIVAPPPPEYRREGVRQVPEREKIAPLIPRTSKSNNAVVATEAEGLARLDACSLSHEIEVQRTKVDLDDIFNDPDAAVADMVDFDFAAGSQRKNN
jgi:hypothetical protein